MMEKVSLALEAAGQPMSGAAIDRAVTGKQVYVAAATKALVDEAYVSRSPAARNAHMHTLLHPYRQAADPASDRYISAGEGQSVETSVDLLPSLHRGTGGGHSTFSGEGAEEVGRRSHLTSLTPASDPAAALCDHCSEPMHPAAAAGGYRTHPGCGDAA